jgi:hypothetical protein
MAGCQVLCDGTQTAPVNYLAGLTQYKKKKGGFTGFALIKNDLVIPDPSDLAAWTALRATAGNIECGPCGTVDLGTPTFNTDVDACGNDEIDETIFNITFTTKYLDPDGLEHVKYFKDFLKSYRCYNLIIFDCDGWPLLTGEYCDYLFDNTSPAPIGSPGFSFTLTQTPTPSIGNNNREQWSFGIQIKLDGEIMLGQSLLPGLYDAICG